MPPARATRMHALALSMPSWSSRSGFAPNVPQKPIPSTLVCSPVLPSTRIGILGLVVVAILQKLWVGLDCERQSQSRLDFVFSCNPSSINKKKKKKKK